MTVDRLTPQREAEIRALHRLADLMDRDDARTATLRRNAGFGNNPVGIPVSYGHYLIRMATIGSTDDWRAEWVQRAREESLQAAVAWSNGQEALIRRLIEVVYPGGATAAALSASEVRAKAAAMAEAVAS